MDGGFVPHIFFLVCCFNNLTVSLSHGLTSVIHFSWWCWKAPREMSILLFVVMFNLLLNCTSLQCPKNIIMAENYSIYFLIFNHWSTTDNLVISERYWNHACHPYGCFDLIGVILKKMTRLFSLQFCFCYSDVKRNYP